MDFMRVQEIHVTQRDLQAARAFTGGACELTSSPAPHTHQAGVVRLSPLDVKAMLEAYTVTLEVTDDFIRLLPPAIISRIRAKAEP